MRIFKDTVTHGVSQGISRLFQFLLLPILARSMSIEEFGECYFALSLANLAPLLYSGFRTTTYQSFLEKEDKGLLTSGLIGQFLFGLLISAPATYLLSGFLPFHFLALATASIFIQQFNSFGLEFFLLKLRTRLYTTCTILQSLFLLILSLTFYSTSHLNGTTYLFSLLLSYLLITPIVFYNLNPFLTSNFQWDKIRSFVHSSIPFTISGMAHFLLTNMDRWMLEEWGASEQLGVYTMALKIINPLTLITVSFKNVWGPLYLTRKEFREYGGNNYVNYLGIFAALLLCTQISSPIGLYYFFPKDYWAAAESVQFLGLSVFFFAVLSFFDYGIYIAKKNHYLVIGTWLACLTNAYLNYSLIPTYGAQGAAIATAFSQLILALFYGVVTTSLSPMSYPKIRGYSITLLYGVSSFFPVLIPPTIVLVLSLSINRIRDTIFLYYERTFRNIDRKTPLPSREV